MRVAEELWNIRLLGGLRVEWKGPSNPFARPFTKLRTQKADAVLACLACTPGRRDRDQLVEWFWSDLAVTSGRANLRVVLNDLRKRLEPMGVPAGTVVMADRRQIGLVPGVYTCDVVAFESLLRPDPNRPPSERLKQLQRAAVYYRQGKMLPGSALDWVHNRRWSLEMSYLNELDELIRLLKEAGNPREVLVACELRLEADPEDLEYRRTVTQLREQLGHTDTVRQRTLTCLQWTEKEQAKSGRASLRRRRRELPMPNALAASALLRLPLVACLFGREEELQILASLLDRERLVTIRGGAGFGKTRLSIEVARQTAFRTGAVVRFVPLAALSDPARTAEEILHALDQPASREISLLDQAIAHLLDLDASVVLVLDNAEHLLPGFAAVVHTLLERVPALTCLVTSREPLSLPGEQIILLTPLPVPTKQEGTGIPSSFILHPSSFAATPSVALFVERAATALPGYKLTDENAADVAALCCRLEGVPLALELAAAWAATHPPARMLAELEARILALPERPERTARHRSLEAALRWSYDLLPAEMRRCFASLAVFRGGWTAEAFAAVCMHPAPDYALKQLQQNSLVQTAASGEEIRFSLLMTLQEFAADRLAEQETGLDPMALSQRHADYYDALLQEAEPHLHSPHLKRWLDQVEREHANIEAAIGWELQHAETPRIVHRHFLRSFWEIRRDQKAVCRWMRSLLPSVTETPARAGLVLRLGANYIGCGKLRHALACLRKSLKMFRALGDGPNQLAALAFLVYQSSSGSNLREALEYSRQGLQLARDLENPVAIARYHGMIGLFLGKLGEFDEARVCYAEAAAHYDRLRERLDSARIQGEIGDLAYREGDWTTAIEHYSDALKRMRELGDSLRTAMLLHCKALAWMALDQLEPAEVASRESLTLFRQLNDRPQIAMLIGLQAAIALRRADCEEALRLVRQAERLWKEAGRQSLIPLPEEIVALRGA